MFFIFESHVNYMRHTWESLFGGRKGVGGARGGVIPVPSENINQSLFQEKVKIPSPVTKDPSPCSQSK